LIELLVVIAIIAILAAIIFPVFMRAKESSYRSGDMTNMNALRSALQLYKADQEAYPPQILGYATKYSSGPQMGSVIPASELRAALYPKRIDSIQTMRPAYDRVGEAETTLVKWPNIDNSPGAIKDLNHDGVIDNNDDLAGARQDHGTDDFFCLVWPSTDPRYTPNCSTYGSSSQGDAEQTESYFYKISGFDASPEPDLATGDPIWRLRYTLRWTNYAMQGGHGNDDPRQLIYGDPPDDTVVTWDSWFRDLDASHIPTHDRKDFVLFLGGTARPYDSNIVYNKSWRLLP
jgi:type II secretory pathway pseudopilin PulG